MPVFKESRKGDLLYGIWRIEENTDELLNFVSTPEIYRERLRLFSSENRRREWLCVRILLNHLCGEEKQIGYHPSGKPFLTDGSFHISISHTKGYVAVMLHPFKEVGIDIEQYGEKVRKVRHKFMREEEEASIIKENEIFHLLLHWSGKETLYKLMGMEGVELQEHLCARPFIPLKEGQFIMEEFKTEMRRTYDIYYFTHPDFVLTYTFQ